LFQCKNRSNYNDGNNCSIIGGNYGSYRRKSRHVRQKCFKLKKKETRYGHNQDSNKNNGNRDQENYDSQDVVFSSTSKNEKFKDDIWFFGSGTCGKYCNAFKSLFNVEEIKEIIMFGNLKCRVIQDDGSGLDITLHKVKFVPQLWVNLFSIDT
jgi:hypothetical protein